MATANPRDSDTESQASRTKKTTSNEQTPLLGGEASTASSSSSDFGEESPEVVSVQEDGQQQQQQQQAEKSHTSGWYIRRILALVAGIAILAVFIKGWVDAGSDVHFDLGNALWKALGGGLSGAASMVLQVLLLMPLRTIMNYQYRFGNTFTGATKTLYHDGGPRRYYQGIGAALFQGPIARFGDTAANAGILALLQSNSYLKDMPELAKTVFASLCAASFRMILTPIDTLKTTLQTRGARGTSILRQRIKTNGIGSLWWGAFATAAATFVGHYPWFATYNSLQHSIPDYPDRHPLVLWLLRLAFIGFVASVVSDSVSNSLRVVKTYRQVNDTNVSYTEAGRLVIQADGIRGLLGRGLKTRILCNGLQSLLFTILWRLFLDLWNEKTGSNST
ncbi:mitochondrial carrier domain-containing protein [Apodospora peruviana]|uniref:Mitochondrial carrier domain-containing protein n=1 Tax=Apodospora peruviana TaxID=516989 RepID=A0AAE0IT26_9PEZI|nr:mitochondrial carrier domain-containing protein [Apodospora peruviana]